MQDAGMLRIAPAWDLEQHLPTYRLTGNHNPVHLPGRDWRESLEAMTSPIFIFGYVAGDGYVLGPGQENISCFFADDEIYIGKELALPVCLGYEASVNDGYVRLMSVSSDEYIHLFIAAFDNINYCLYRILLYRSIQNLRSRLVTISQRPLWTIVEIHNLFEVLGSRVVGRQTPPVS
jgi:hypothetical protein